MKDMNIQHKQLSMFIKWTILIALLIILIFSVAQANAQIQVEAGAHLNIQNNVHIVVTGDVENDGTISSDAISSLRLAGTSQQEIRGTAMNASTFGNIILDNSNGLILNTNVVVITNFDFQDGSTSLNNSDLNIQAGGTISGNNNTNRFFITNGDGMLYRTNLANEILNYPIASALNAVDCTPAQIVNSGASDAIGMRVYNNAYKNYDANGNPIGGTLNTDRVQKTWIVNEAVAGGSVLNLTLNFNGSNEDPSFNRTKCGIDFFLNGTTSPDLSPGQAVGVDPYSRTRTVAQTFNNMAFIVAESQAPLPVELLDFTAINKTQFAELNWLTSSETNNSHFNIERSFDGLNFEKIGEIKGNGNSNQENSYEFLDYDLPSFKIKYVYYRLKQVDFDGEFNYSEIRNLILSQENTIAIKAFPNPTANFATIQVNSSLSTNLKYQLYDVSGRIIEARNLSISAGTNNFPIDLSTLATGIYQLKISDEQGNYYSAIKLMKVARN